VTFSREWDQLYRADAQMSIWPWSDLVSYVHRYAKPTDGFRRVLELGCGAGANIPFFLKLGLDYYAIEGSEAIVTKLHADNPEMREKIVVGDFTQVIPFSGLFDLVVDRGSLTHNNTQAIRRALSAIFSRLRSGGKFIGIDWFSNTHHDAKRGDALDSHTRINLPSSSTLSGLGAVHFSDKEHLLELFTTTGFRVERLEHHEIRVVLPNSNDISSSWNCIMVKQ